MLLLAPRVCGAREGAEIKLALPVGPTTHPPTHHFIVITTPSLSPSLPHQPPLRLRLRLRLWLWLWLRLWLWLNHLSLTPKAGLVGAMYMFEWGFT
jgi:hypothetical protein